MKIVVEALINELSQEITYSGERCSIAAFIPYLYCHNATGEFTFEISSNYGVVFSKNFTISDIKSSIGTLNNYFHVFYPIIPINPIQLESGDFTFKIIAGSGYTQSQDSFIGWVQQHEDKQLKENFVPIYDSQGSFSLRFKVYSEGKNV